MLHKRRGTWSPRSRRVAGLGLLLGLVFGLLACGPAAPSAPTTAPAPATSAPAPAATPTAAQPPAGATTAAVQPPAATPAGATPKMGGVLTIRWWTGDPPDLDPYLNTSFRSQEFAGFFYSRLLKFDSGPGIKVNSFIPTGDLSDKWTVSSDGLSYTFHIR